MNGTFLTILPNVWLFTWLLLGAVELLFTALIGNAGIAMLVMDLLLFPIGLANLFIMNVRGTPFLPADILGVGDSDRGSFHLHLLAYTGTVCSASCICNLVYLNLPDTQEGNKTPDSKETDPLCRYGCTGHRDHCCIIQYKHFTGSGIQDNVWNKISSCKANGFYMNYFINLHYLRVSTPSGYSEDKVSDILKEADSYPDNHRIVTTATTSVPLTDGKGTTQKMATNASFTKNTSLNGKKPNIILIMNESLADFSLVGDVRYNRDPLSYIHSLTKNTIKGRDYVSVFGAGTQ